MIKIKEKLIICLNFLGVNIACSFFQVMVLLILIAFQAVLWFGSGQIMWYVFGNAQQGLDIAPIISWAIVYIVYALVWFIFWVILFSGEVRWFYWRVTFSTLPLVVALIMFNPTPNPMAMIPLSIAETKFQFSTIVTGIVLFPIYSIGIYKFILLKPSKKVRIKNTIYVCVTMILIGSLVFTTSWNLMQKIY